MADVLVRVRPLSSTCGRCISVTDDKVVVTAPGQPTGLSFAFASSILDERATQHDVFTRVAPQLERVLAGYNAAVMVYGQSGAGKTHTMGTAESHNAAGLVQQLTQLLFNKLSTGRVTLTLVEIYKERLRDLLCPSRENLCLHEGERGTYVGGATEVEVADAGEVNHWLAEGVRNRAVAATLLNSDSSRSHLVLTLTVECGTCVGKLNLVDLAGSEKLKRSGATGDTLKEGMAINRSLSALGNVISALTAGDVASNAVIPYRDSKLTRLLKECLSGTAFITLVVCISPAAGDASDTVASLRFGARAKSLPCAPVSHKLEAAASMQTLQRAIQERDATIEALQERLAAMNGEAATSAGLSRAEIANIVVAWLLASATMAARSHLWMAMQ
jgi:kinesin family member 5